MPARANLYAILIACGSILTGCGDNKPTENEAFQIAKKEISMALCGDKTASCFISEGGNANVSDKKTDGTYGVSATFSSIKGKDIPIKYNEGAVFLDIDAKTNAVYIKSIDVWSSDGKQKISLCGRDYKFCSK